MKLCSECKILKTRSYFHKRRSSKDGYRSECKECRAKEHATNPYPARRRAKKAREIRLEHYKELNRIWKQRNKKKYNNYRYDWRTKNPVKARAHWTVNNAIRRGILQKQNCHCGAEKVHAHHTDYTKPLNIMWVCDKHHKEIHKTINK